MAEALDPVYASEDPRLLPRHMAGEQELAKVLPRTTLRCDVGVNSSVTRTAPFGIGSQQAAVCRLSVAAAISDKPGDRLLLLLFCCLCRNARHFCTQQRLDGACLFPGSNP